MLARRMVKPRARVSPVRLITEQSLAYSYSLASKVAAKKRKASDELTRHTKRAKNVGKPTVPTITRTKLPVKMKGPISIRKATFKPQIKASASTRKKVSKTVSSDPLERPTKKAVRSGASKASPSSTKTVRSGVSKASPHVATAKEPTKRRTRTPPSAMKVPVPPKRRAPGKTTAKRPAAHTKEKGEVDLSNYSYGEAPADSGGVAGQLDLVFCLDCTGSMSSVISACQASILSLVESLTHAEGQDVRFCLIPYRDHGAGEAFCTRVYPFTRDVAQMQANVNAQEACGGGDTPEAVAAAMYEALCLDWRDGAAKLVVVMADAGPHGLGEGAAFPDGDPDGKDPLVIAREMHGLGVAVYSVVSGGTERTRHFFAAVAAMTGGQSVDLRDAALLGDAILAGAREAVDLEGRMGPVRGRLAAAAARKGAPLTEAEADAEARAALEAAAAAGGGAGPRTVPADRVISIRPERLAQARAAASITALRALWDGAAAAGAAPAAAAGGGGGALVRRVAAMAAAREARPTGRVLIECVAVKGRLRARVVSDGYDGGKNCQFPRGVRAEGRRFWAEAVVDAGGFYRVKGRIDPA